MGEVCPTCGDYCLGKGGVGCIDKPSSFGKFRKNVIDKIPIGILERGEREQTMNPASSRRKTKDSAVARAIIWATHEKLMESRGEYERASADLNFYRGVARYAPQDKLPLDQIKVAEDDVAQCYNNYIDWCEAFELVLNRLL